MAALAGCYQPTPQAGAPCGDQGACPDPLVCSPATQTCETSLVTIDAEVPLDGPEVDGAVDAAPDAALEPDASSCATSFSTLYPTCDVMFPSGTTQLGSITIDTDAATSADFPVWFLGGPGNETRFAAMNDLKTDPGATIAIIGSHPIVFLVNGQAEIRGRITLVDGGAGARACNAAAGHDSDTGASGGGGGGLQGFGGGGGPSDSDTNPQVGGAGGSTTTFSPTVLVGGCHGGNGGEGTLLGGLGGRGGGAIGIAVRTSIFMNSMAVINAGGGGGKTGTIGGDAGGGGGGSGGTIYLEAAAVNVQGTLAANGGGGGTGSTATQIAGQDGQPGQAGKQVARGGDAISGDGGNGGFDTTLNGMTVTVSTTTGSGGGGGGVGFVAIRTPSMQNGGTVSPPYLQVP